MLMSLCSTKMELLKLFPKTLSYKHSTKAQLVRSLNLKGLTHNRRRYD